MALVHKKPVNAQLFKGNYIVFTLIGAQFFQLGFQRFPGLSICLMENSRLRGLSAH